MPNISFWLQGVWCVVVSNFPDIHLQDEWLLVAKGIFQRNVQV